MSWDFDRRSLVMSSSSSMSFKSLVVLVAEQFDEQSPNVAKQ